MQENNLSIAIRYHLQNRTGFSINLESIKPLSCFGAKGLLLQGKTAGEWELVLQSRLKNGIPTSVRPGNYDSDYEQAARYSSKIENAVDSEGRPTFIECDPACIIRPLNGEDNNCLLIGFLSLKGHLYKIQLKTDAKRQALESLNTLCEFDGTLLPAGGVRTSQWVLLMPGKEPNEMMHDYADRIGDYYGVKKPGGYPPSVFLTWYYKAILYSEKDLEEDLDYLKENNFPFDVFLIDECWNQGWGDWYPNEKWPSGMKAASDKIGSLGLTPGIWTAPYLVAPETKLAFKHPEWLLRKRDGSLAMFYMMGRNHYILDLTYPGVTDFIERMYHRLTYNWGFTFHKLDFLRAVFTEENVSFYDKTATRLEAYERGLMAVRRGIGSDLYLSVCGGHYGGSLGIANTQRSGSDVRSKWDDPPAVQRIKQNILRTWMGRLWHPGADAMMVRRRSTPAIDHPRFGKLSIGMFNDDEAVTVAVNQYIAGGMMCFTENFSDIDEDRKELYKHVIPSINSPSIPIDFFAKNCPSVLLTNVKPLCKNLKPWKTVTVINIEDNPVERNFTLSEKILGKNARGKYILWDFMSQSDLGVFSAGDRVNIGFLKPHASKIIRIAEWDGSNPVLAGTDLHFSGGGVEIAEWKLVGNKVEGRIKTPWKYPVKITAAFPSGDSYQLKSTVVAPGEEYFQISVK